MPCGDSNAAVLGPFCSTADTVALADLAWRQAYTAEF
jgi:hypothetical protein